MPETDRNSAGRGLHLTSLIASTVLHASFVAALACVVIETDAIQPEAIVVELVSNGGTGPPGSDAAGAREDSAAGAGETPHETTQTSSVETQRAVNRAPQEATDEPGPPVPRPHVEATKPRPELKALRRLPPQPTVVEPAAATAPTRVAKPTMPTEDALSPSDGRVPSDGRLVASLGAAGAGSATGGGSGRPGAGAGDDGATRGPGFSLGGAGNPMPKYPPAARRRGIEGKVVLDVLVSAEGQALSVAIARSSGSSLLDEAARESIARWRFRPAMREEEAIEARATVPVQFSLVEP